MANLNSTFLNIPPEQTSGGGGIASINGDTTKAQVITGGTGISVATSGGTTTVTNTQSAGITALVGDVTASGSGSVSAHLVATSNSTLITLSSLSLPSSQITGVSANSFLGNNTGSTSSASSLSIIQSNILLTIPVYSIGNSGSAATVNWNNGPYQQITLSANCSVSMINPVSGAAYILEVVQGSSPYSLSLTNIKWVGGNIYAPSAGSGAIDQVNLAYNGLTSSYRGTYGQGYA